MQTNTFAARMGRWSAQHRKTAIWGWIAFVVVALLLTVPTLADAGLRARCRRLCGSTVCTSALQERGASGLRHPTPGRHLGPIVFSP